MKIFISLLFFCRTLFAFGYPQVGYVITSNLPAADQLPLRSGQQTTLSGSICLKRYVTVGSYSSYQCQSTNWHQVEVRAYFPDLNTDVTSEVTFDREHKELNYSYQTPALDASSENRLIIIVGSLKDKTKRLLQLQSKINRRIIYFEQLIAHFEAIHMPEHFINYFKAFVASLQSSVGKIETVIAGDPNILARNYYSLLVDGNVASSSENTATFGGIRMSLTATPGAISDGGNIHVQASLFNMSHLDFVHPGFGFWMGEGHERGNQYRMVVKFKGEEIYRSDKFLLEEGGQKEYGLDLEALNSTDTNKLEFELLQDRRGFIPFFNTKGWGKIEQVVPVAINTNQAPIAEFSFEPVSGKAPLSVNFDASASNDPDGVISEYLWTINGESFSGVQLGHTFEQAGEYQVKLVVTDEKGATGEIIKTITILPTNVAPIAQFSFTPEGGDAPLNVSFDASGSSDSDGEILEYLWSFSDGAIQRGITTTHIFESAGIHTIVLKVTDNDGAFFILEKTIEATVPNVAPDAQFSFTPTSGDCPLTVNFDATTSSDSDGTIRHYNWVFGDGVTASGVTVSHVFASEGTFVIKLTVVDNDGASDQIEKSIVITKPNVLPIAVFNFVPQTGKAPLKVSLDASASGDSDGAIVNYAWSISNGASLMGPQVEYTFNIKGEYQITLQVTDDRGGVTSFAQTITILPENIAPVSHFEISESSGIVPLVITADASGSSDDTQIILYQWDWGDGVLEESTGPTSEHTFNEIGNYSVRLTVFDQEGLSDSSEQLIEVLSGDESAPIVEINPMNGTVFDSMTPIIYVSLFDDSMIDYSRLRLQINGVDLPERIASIDQMSNQITISFDEQFPMFEGFNVLSVWAVDSYMNTTQEAFYFEVVDEIRSDTKPPIINFEPKGGELTTLTPQVIVYFADESPIDFDSLQLKLNDMAIPAELFVIEPEAARVVINFAQSFPLADDKFSILQVRIADQLGNQALGLVGFDTIKNNVTVLAGGDVNVAYHTCVILQNEKAKCWGYNSYGQLGLGHTEIIGDDELPSSIGELELGAEVKQITTGSFHSCALLSDGNVKCWGLGNYGSLGYGNANNIGDDETLESLGTISLGAKVVQLSSGAYHNCVLFEDGNVKCWGWNLYGQLGPEMSTEKVGDDELPSDVENVDLGGVRALSVTAGSYHTCAILEGGNVRCWGMNKYGMLGYEESSEPGNAKVGDQVVQISLGEYHSCVLYQYGAVRCFGNNNYGQLGLGHTEVIGDDEAPSSVSTINIGGIATQICSGNYYNCVLLNDGAVRCWGYNYSGQLGYGHTLLIGDDEVPATAGDVNVGGDVAELKCGVQSVCAILQDGHVVCWGAAIAGTPGYGSTENIGDDEVPADSGYVDVGELVQVATAGGIPDILAEFTATPNAGPAPLEIFFDASNSVSKEGTIVDYLWDFGDGQIINSSQAILTHLYDQVGVYIVNLTVTDSNNQSDSSEKIINVGQENIPPAAILTVDNRSGMVPVWINFNAENSYDINGQIVSYVFDTGDGVQQGGESPFFDYQYQIPGIYLVTVTVEDNEGAQSTSAPQVIIVRAENEIPVANFSCSISDKTINCNASGAVDYDGDIVGYHWILDDGSEYEQEEFTHVFSDYGTYQIYLEIIDNNDGLGEASKMVVLNAPNISPVAAFDFSPLTGEAPLTVTFDGTASNDPDGSIVSFSWNFGDGAYGTGAQIEHSYLTAGTYSAVLTVTDDLGVQGTTSMIVTVLASNQAPVASFTYGNGPEEMSLLFDASSSMDSDGQIVSYYWNISDGTVLDGVSVEHTFSQVGEYQVTLSVIDDDGASGEITQVVRVTIEGDGPKAEISYQQIDVRTALFDIKKTAYQNPVSYVQEDRYVIFVDFGDGQNDYQREPFFSHEYEQAGTYNVTLSVEDRQTGIFASKIIAVSVSDEIPASVEDKIAFFYYNDHVSTNVVFFINQSEDLGDENSFYWDFGDGSKSYHWNSVHAYDASGVYQVSLVFISASGEEIKDTRSVVVAGDGPSVRVNYAYCSIDELAVYCAGNVFDPDYELASVTIGWGDGEQTVYDNSSKNWVDISDEHQYNAYGTYQVVITAVNSNGDSFSSTREIIAENALPVADFYCNISGLYLYCSADGSYDENGYLVDYRWSLSDGSSFNGYDFEYILGEVGTYQITLEVEDNVGATSSVSYNFLIGTNPPVASFNWTPSGGLGIVFDASDSYDDGEIVSYQWNFGDGSVSTESYVTHYFSEEGTYVVSLKVTDNDGISNTTAQEMNVITANYLPVPVMNCISEKIFTVSCDASQSYDQDGQIVAYEWDFHDGNTAAGEVIEYTASGNNNGLYVTLTVIDDAGGSASISSTVELTINTAPYAIINCYKKSAQTIHCDGSGSFDVDGILAFYHWDMGDGGTSAEAEFDYTYENAGEYEIFLTVTDEFGYADSRRLAIVIEESGEDDPLSAGTLTVSNLDLSYFVDVSSDVVFALKNVLLASDENYRPIVYVNNLTVKQESIEISAERNSFTLKGVLRDGKNEIEIIAYDEELKRIEQSFTIWAGEREITVTAVDDVGNAIENGEINIRLLVNQSVNFTKTLSAGTVCFSHVPRGGVVFTGKDNQERFGSGVLYDKNTSGVQIRLKAISIASEVDNNDFSGGTAGWDVEGEAQVVGSSDNNAASNKQNLLAHSGSISGETMIRRTFKADPNKPVALTRFKFTGAHVHDFYSVTLRTLKGKKTVFECNDMQGLGIDVSDGIGRSSVWREVGIEVTEEDETVELIILIKEFDDENITVNLWQFFGINCAYAGFSNDVSLELDGVQDRDVMISNVELFDSLENKLTHLSMGDYFYQAFQYPFSGFLDPANLLKMKFNFVGDGNFPVGAVSLEIIGKNNTNDMISVNLTTPMKDFPMPINEIPTAFSSIYLPSGMELSENNVVSLKFVLHPYDQSSPLEFIVKNVHDCSENFHVLKSLLFSSVNNTRYSSDYDFEVGGDDWVRVELLPAFRAMFSRTYGPAHNDASKMNGGLWLGAQGHPGINNQGSHKFGNSIDLRTDGFAFSDFNRGDVDDIDQKMDAIQMVSLIEHINGASDYDVLKVVVSMGQQVNLKGNLFYKRIDHSCLENGQLARDVIENDGPDRKHTNHFHLEIDLMKRATPERLNLGKTVHRVKYDGENYIVEFKQVTSDDGSVVDDKLLATGIEYFTHVCDNELSGDYGCYDVDDEADEDGDGEFIKLDGIGSEYVAITDKRSIRKTLGFQAIKMLALGNLKDNGNIACVEQRLWIKGNMETPCGDEFGEIRFSDPVIYGEHFNGFVALSASIDDNSILGADVTEDEYSGVCGGAIVNDSYVWNNSVVSGGAVINNSFVSDTRINGGEYTNSLIWMGGNILTGHIKMDGDYVAEPLFDATMVVRESTIQSTAQLTETPFTFSNSSIGFSSIVGKGLIRDSGLYMSNLSGEVTIIDSDLSGAIVSSATEQAPPLIRNSQVYNSTVGGDVQIINSKMSGVSVFSGTFVNKYCEGSLDNCTEWTPGQ